MTKHLAVLAAVSVVSFAFGSLVSEARSQATLAAQPEPVYLVNFMKVRSDHTAVEYEQMEREIWRPIHQESVRAGRMLSWSLYRVQFPHGTRTEYDYVTVDAFASLEDAERDMTDILARVYPNMTTADAISRAVQTRDLVRGELWALIDSVR